MTTTQIVELLVALAMIVAAVVLYRRRSDPDHGSQGAVILLIIGLILAIHGLGLLEYRPGGGL